MKQFNVVRSLARRLVASGTRIAAAILLIPTVVYAVRPGDIASFICPQPLTSQYFSGVDYPYSGGVVPRGRVNFFSEDETSIPVANLTIVFRPENYEVKPDRDAIQIVYDGREFALPIPDIQIAPMLKFIDRNAVVAYTIPPIDPDETYLTHAGLKELPFPYEGSYVAKEFAHPKLISLLNKVDLYTITEELAPELEHQLIKNAHGGRQAEQVAVEGSYVNADFDVIYHAYLVTSQSGNYVDIAGRPLSYIWDVGLSGKGVVSGVEIFQFPTRSTGLQFEAVLFFQNAGVFRQYKTDNPHGFAELLNAVQRTVDK